MNNYDLSKFLSNKKFEKCNFTEKDFSSYFCQDLNYDRKYGDRITDNRKLILSLRPIRHVGGKGLEIVFTSSDSNELVNRLKLLHQEKMTGNDCKSINEEKIAKIDKLLEYECLTKGKHASFIKRDLSEIYKFTFFFTFITNNFFLYHLI